MSDMRDERATARPQERDEGRPDRVPPVGEDRDDGTPSADEATGGAATETVAPEERGATPATEHAPGGDL